MFRHREPGSVVEDSPRGNPLFHLDLPIASPFWEVRIPCWGHFREWRICCDMLTVPVIAFHGKAKAIRSLEPAFAPN